MDNRNTRNSSQDLKRRPERRSSASTGTRSERAARNTREYDASRDISSSSSGKSVDLLSMSSRAQNKKKRGKLILFNVLLSIVLVFSSISFIGAAMLDSKILKRNSVDEAENGDFAQIVASDNKNVAYFLVCGVDLSENLTDVIMVVCYDLANNEASVLQIPRDTFIGTDIPTGKVNAVYGSAKKGESKIKSLIRCINSKFGIPIDHYATVTIEGLENIIDIMGGVDITLSKQMKLTDDTGSEDVHNYVGPGDVHLDGQWGVAFIRHRASYAQGDMGRMKAQRSVYAAVLKKLTQLDFGQITGIVTKCADDVSTDLTLGQMLGYAKKVRELNLDSVKIMSVPGQSGYYRPTGESLSYYSVHKQELAEMLNEYFRPYESSAITPSDMEVTELHTQYDNSYGSFLEGGSLSNFDTQSDDDSGS